MLPLLGKTLQELQEITASLDMPRFTAKQMAQWIYEKRVRRVADMTNLSLANRQKLVDAGYEVGYEDPADAAVSRDGTIRYLFATQAGKHIESVYIPDHDRATLCVSSQIGCKMNCYFCMTGKQGFNGQLTTHQIMNQIFAIPESLSLTNLVFMGMGEPLDNWAEVSKALEIITAPWGMAWSPKRVTLSTIGQMQHLPDFLRDSQCHLAISIHSPFADERAQLMPVQRAYPMADVLALLREHDWSHQRNLTFEYIVFKGLNDDSRHAHALIKLLAGLQCKVNLIRFHAIPDVDLQTSDIAQMERFRDLLNEHGLTATIRASRGEDIFAACGMLSSMKRGG
ncbi:MAG: 23S rRNA (adenine(2503)-C(2))-methyltransferase RlmN [Bacteroidales bacterium]|jgi:23S rRNA (adenine2503-C2)-methyltransferase|nr:23S rRNA (adenine(2503)-C(2))-methyltransferase RlmN [Bacteroidales bacterium]